MTLWYRRSSSFDFTHNCDQNLDKIDKYSFFREKRKGESDDLVILDHLHLPGTLNHLREQSGLELHLPGTSAHRDVHLAGLVHVVVGLVREFVGLVHVVVGLVKGVVGLVVSGASIDLLAAWKKLKQIFSIIKTFFLKFVVTIF